MAEVRAFAEILLWGRTVGGVVELDDGGVVFEYAEEFRRSGLEISPIQLPLSVAGPVRFEELRRSESFQGLPGVLADALPDAFGRTVIRSYYTARGQEARALSPVQHLLYIGERALGALVFRPPAELRPPEQDALELAALVQDARRVLRGEVDVTIPEIYRIGASAGGMRPKAVVLYDPTRQRVRSGFADPEPGELSCILKFDGVATGAVRKALGEPQPFNRVEAAYARMARDAALDVVEVQLLESEEGHAHLLIPRFDRKEGRRLHQHTLGGLLHVDYNLPGASSYEEYLRTILRLGMPHAAVVEGFRRMVFNVFAVNQDDHVKNLSFHMDETGKWALTPAYDLTFAKGGGFTAEHQMRVADKTTGITRDDLLHVAANFGIRAPKNILAEVENAVGRWAQYASQTGVPSETAAAVEQELSARRGQLRG